MSGAKYHDMVQALAPDGANDAFCVWILPRRAIGGKNFLNAECLGLSAKVLSIYGITVTDKILRLFIHAAGLDQLLCGPGGARMIGYVDMQYPRITVSGRTMCKTFVQPGQIRLNITQNIRSESLNRCLGRRIFRVASC